MFQGLGFALLKYKEVLKSTRSWINRPDLLKYQVRSPALSLAVLSSSKKKENHISLFKTRSIVQSVLGMTMYSFVRLFLELFLLLFMEMQQKSMHLEN